MLNQLATPPSRVFHALADPTRMAMVERLSLGPASVSELARPLAISLPGVLQHLAVLEADGLVRSEKAGRVRTCRIEPAAPASAGDWVAQRRALWESSLDRLEEYLAAEGDRRTSDARRPGRRAREAGDDGASDEYHQSVRPTSRKGGR